MKRQNLEESKAAETVLANGASGAGVEDIDQHILFRMSGEESREDFNELFLLRCIRVHETIPHIEAMWAFAAIQPHPVS